MAAGARHQAPLDGTPGRRRSSVPDRLVLGRPFARCASVSCAARATAGSFVDRAVRQRSMLGIGAAVTTLMPPTRLMSSDPRVPPRSWAPALVTDRAEPAQRMHVLSASRVAKAARHRLGAGDGRQHLSTTFTGHWARARAWRRRRNHGQAELLEVLRR
jgi:hypothetical protein